MSEPEPVGEPDAIQIEDGKPIVFSVEVEVVPEIPMPSLEKVPVKKPLVAVTD